MRKGVILLFFLPISIISAAQYNINAAATFYYEDFNILTNGTWTDNSTVIGWYAKTDATANITSYGANTGGTVTGGLYAYGVAGTNPLSERSLGFASSNSFTGSTGVGKGYIGWRLKNNTGTAISSISVTWTGEQWRKENNAASHTLQLFYQTGTTVTNLTSGSWTDASSVFTSPITGSTTATVLDGNAPANRVTSISATITVTIPPDDEIMLRWEDLNDSGNDHLLSIDDVTIYATAGITNTITTSALSATTFNLPDCFTTASGTVDFTSTGTFNSGNIYTAQLSDAAGSFAAPTTIGSITSTGNSGTINFTIPAGTASGTLYKIRVVSSNPYVTGSSSADITINQAGSCTSNATDYFRSKASGSWNTSSAWESSPTGTVGTWINATLTPTNTAKTISIRSGHTVTMISATTADEIVVENGGILENNMPASNIFTLTNGSGDDLTIINGGVYRVISGQNYANHLDINAGATIRIQSGGMIQIGDGGTVGGGNSAYASIAGTYIWEDASLFYWNTTTTPGIQTTFFPDASLVIPVFRFGSTPSFSIGGGSPTIINGRLEATSTINFTGNGTKTFRNGIFSSSVIDGLTGSSGKFIINGQTAVLGGSGSLIVPSSGLEIGSSSNSVTVTVSDNKIISGNVNLLSANPTNIELNASDLTVSGSITGGSATSYIKTNGSGALILGNVTGIRQAPVGFNTYNPVTITNSSGHNWSVRVEDNLVVTNPSFAVNVPKAVQREWHITPSVNPPLTGADIVFEYDDNPGASPRQTGLSFNNTENVQTWHEIFYVPTGTFEWLSAGNAQTPTGSAGGYRTVSIFNWTWFSPFAISNISAPLPIKLTRFDAVKQTASRAMISWELAACCSKEARFELEKSTDGRNYILLATLTGSETSRLYSHADNQLTAGITYYRLKAIDADGKVTYSPVATVINTDGGMFTISFMPNPAGEQAILTVTAAKKETVQFSIISSSGLLVRQWQQSLAPGTQAANIDLQALPAGIYQLVCQGQAERAVVRFIKH